MGVDNLFVVLLGMSASGKDSILNELHNRGYLKAISATTRPKRSNEIEGADYYFVSEEEFANKKDFISKRVYETYDKDGFPAIWHYGLTAQEIDLENGDYVTIVDYPGLKQLKENCKNICAIYVDASPKLRRERAESRSNDFSIPEWIRREGSDKENFEDLSLINAVVRNEGITIYEATDKVEEIIKMAKSLKSGR